MVVKEMKETTLEDERTHIDSVTWHNKKRLKEFFLHLRDDTFNVATNATVWNEVPMLLSQWFNIECESKSEIIKIARKHSYSKNCMRFKIICNPLSQHEIEKILEENRTRVKFNIDELVNF